MPVLRHKDAPYLEFLGRTWVLAVLKLFGGCGDRMTRCPAEYELASDSILVLIRAERFSVRRAFFAALDEFRKVPGEEYSIAWPDALLYITSEQWNSAYRAAMAKKDAA